MFRNTAAVSHSHRPREPRSGYEGVLFPLGETTLSAAQRAPGLFWRSLKRATNLTDPNLKGVSV